MSIKSNDTRIGLFHQLSHFELGKTIADTTFGKLRLAIHKPTKEKVIIHIIEKNLYTDPAEALILKNNVQSVQLIKHTNIVQLFTILDTNQAIYLLFDFIEGKSIMNYLVEDKKKLSEDEAREVFIQILKAITYLIKDLNIFHRGLTLDKILINPNTGKIVILSPNNSNNPMINRKLLSTPYNNSLYTSPEVLKLQEYDPEKAEIWSLGVILYALVCGYLPFDNMVTDILIKTMEDCRFTIPNHISSELSDLIKNLLTPNPSKRPFLEEIYSHAWLKDSQSKLNKISGLNTKEYFVPVNYNIISMITKSFPVNKDDIICSVILNKHNTHTSLYYLTAKRIYKELNDLNGDTLSKFQGIDFETYIKDDKNKIIKYENWVDYFIDKISSIETANFFINEQDTDLISKPIKLANNTTDNKKVSLLKRTRRDTVLTDLVSVNEIGETNLQSKLRIFQGTKKPNTNLTEFPQNMMNRQTIRSTKEIIDSSMSKTSKFSKNSKLSNTTNRLSTLQNIKKSSQNSSYESNNSRKQSSILEIKNSPSKKLNFKQKPNDKNELFKKPTISEMSKKRNLRIDKIIERNESFSDDSPMSNKHLKFSQKSQQNKSINYSTKSKKLKDNCNIIYNNGNISIPAIIPCNNSLCIIGEENKIEPKKIISSYYYSQISSGEIAFSYLAASDSFTFDNIEVNNNIINLDKLESNQFLKGENANSKIKVNVNKYAMSINSYCFLIKNHSVISTESNNNTIISMKELNYSNYMSNLKIVNNVSLQIDENNNNFKKAKDIIMINENLEDDNINADQIITQDNEVEKMNMLINYSKNNMFDKEVENTINLELTSSRKVRALQSKTQSIIGSLRNSAFEFSIKNCSANSLADLIYHNYDKLRQIKLNNNDSHSQDLSKENKSNEQQEKSPIREVEDDMEVEVNTIKEPKKNLIKVSKKVNNTQITKKNIIKNRINEFNKQKESNVDKAKIQKSQSLSNSIEKTKNKNNIKLLSKNDSKTKINIDIFKIKKDFSNSLKSLFESNGKQWNTLSASKSSNIIDKKINKEEIERNKIKSRIQYDFNIKAKKLIINLNTKTFQILPKAKSAKASQTTKVDKTSKSILSSKKISSFPKTTSNQFNKDLLFKPTKSNIQNNLKNNNKNIFTNNEIHPCDLLCCVNTDKAKLKEIIEDYLIDYELKHPASSIIQHGEDIIRFRSEIKFDFDISFNHIENNFIWLSFFIRYGPYKEFRELTYGLLKKIHNV